MSEQAWIEVKTRYKRLKEVARKDEALALSTSLQKAVKQLGDAIAVYEEVSFDA